MRYSLTQERLKEILDYNQYTGIFTWKIRPSYRADISDLAGSKNPDGYFLIQIKGIKYFNHILAHLYMTGRWPEGEIDHKNRIRDDNRWENLQDVPREVNRLNMKWPTGASGVTGIHATKHNTWAVILKKRHYGTFKTIEEAEKFLGGLEN